MHPSTTTLEQELKDLDEAGKNVYSIDAWHVISGYGVR
jgi:hypothetical protein